MMFLVILHLSNTIQDLAFSTNGSRSNIPLFFMHTTMSYPRPPLDSNVHRSMISSYQVWRCRAGVPPFGCAPGLRRNCSVHGGSLQMGFLRYPPRLTLPSPHRSHLLGCCRWRSTTSLVVYREYLERGTPFIPPAAYHYWYLFWLCLRIGMAIYRGHPNTSSSSWHILHSFIHETVAPTYLL